MSRYDELLEAARRMPPKRVAPMLRTLARDERFVAVVAWLEANREGFHKAASAQALADSHGRMAHAAGSAHALEIVCGQLRAAAEPERRPDIPEDHTGSD